VKRPHGPLLVYGPRSASYDFGEGHPLTPRRFGPGIELLRAVGAQPDLAPEPASDEDLQLCHDAAYVAAVRRVSADPWSASAPGIGRGGDNPAFAGMHEAGAMVAGGTLRAMEAILRGDVEHAFHPGGGLHHAMRDRASGFCIYDDPALAIARARRDGRRVLYMDLDVHHGDGVQALFWNDPGVLTVSFHESGRYLFPGTGFPHELGGAAAAGTSVNVPFEPYAGEAAWLEAVESIVPALAAAFGPDVVVSQHGGDSHAWDPLAHLRVTTTAMGAAARLVDRVAHRYAGGRWLATGGGGYDAYRVVPRAWSLVWLAGAHRETPAETPAAWRERWSSEAARYGQVPLPTTFDDAPNAGEPVDSQQRAAERASRRGAAEMEAVVVPALLREARDRRWWSPLDPGRAARVGAQPPNQEPTLVPSLDAATLDRLGLATGVIPPADPAAGRAILAAAVQFGDATAAAAVAGDVIVGIAIQVDGRLAALGVAPAFRRSGVATALLGSLVSRHGGPLEAVVTVAERDPLDPLPRDTRALIARRLLEGAGFGVELAGGGLGRIDSEALVGRRAPAPPVR